MQAPPTHWAPPPRHRPCTVHTRRCAEARNYRRVLAPCCRQHVIDIMAAVDAACIRHGVTWWLDYGSLLGAVRNPLLGFPAGIVLHDKDGDAGVLGEHWDTFRDVVCRELAADFDILIRADRPGDDLFRGGSSIKVRRSARNHTNVDFFPWYPDGAGNLRRKAYINADRFKGREFPESWLLPLRRVFWEGLQLPVPNESERLVAHRYGKNWKTPIAANNDGIRR